MSGSFACSGDDDQRFSSEKKILSFEHEKLIEIKSTHYTEYKFSDYFIVTALRLVWAEGTDLTSLAPNITVSPGATLIPKSGVSLDFSTQVQYVVTAEDGTTIYYEFLSETEEQFNSP
jgi:hypothetical protein